MRTKTIEINEWEAAVIRTLISQQKKCDWSKDNLERMESIRQKLTPF